ncbi:MAG: ABC transporter ATP-binding protein/permease [Clostridiales bacterium]|nr:ABC transporter ATP-binding protein/permease [Clostridiales bacterium]
MTFIEALSLLKPYRRQMGAIMALALAISAVSMVTPFVNRNMLDEGLLQGDTAVVIRLVLLLILLQVGGQLIEYLQRLLEIGVTNALGKKLKTEAFAHGLKLKPGYFKEQGFYKTISDALYDISNIMSIASNSFMIIFVIICKCIGALIGLVILDWRLTLFVLLIMPVKLWLNAAIRRRAEKRSRELMEDNKSYNAWLSGILSGVIDVKLWNLREKVTSEYESHVGTINRSSKKLSLLNARNRFFTAGVEFTLMNGLYILGAYLIAGGRLTFGGLMAFITFTAYVLMPVNVIMDLRIILRQISPSVEGLRRFHALEEERYGPGLPFGDKVSVIEFRDVSVTLGDREILKGFNMKVSRGETVAIVGDNGSGKTTVVNLLLRLCEPDEGQILMDGIPITEYNIEDYRQRFSVVYQDIHLFEGTVRDNITFGESGDIPYGGDEGLRFCTEAIESWEERYETQVGSDGGKLSGGEQQKIALLRALYRKAEILVLDEPTSNYDKESEVEFRRYIERDMDYDFCFIVTHDMGVAEKADTIYHLS